MVPDQCEQMRSAFAVNKSKIAVRSTRRQISGLVGVLLIAGASCDCSGASAIRDAADLPDTYAFRKVNDIDLTNQLVVNADGGYCHSFRPDGGLLVQCGA